MIRLGVNIDHVATLRQARGEGFPDPLEAALACVRGGAEGITAHLREDRRHIQDDDLFRLQKALNVPLNMEMAARQDIIEVAEKVKPSWVCLVPEKREELTTERGLDVWANKRKLAEAIKRLQAAGTAVSLFINPEMDAVRQAKEIGADAVELHTGTYARAHGGDQLDLEHQKLIEASQEAAQLGLFVNAGHGLNYENVGVLARSFSYHEFNIGFSIVSRALMIGLEEAVRLMKEAMKV